MGFLGVARRWWPAAVAVVLACAWFLAGRATASAAFQRIEEDSSAQKAHVVQLALDYETQLIAGYGRTNSMWDDVYAEVRDGDEKGFELDFPAREVSQVDGLDAVLGVGPDGSLRLGGIISGDRYSRPGPELTRPDVLRGLFAVDGTAGTQRCGLLTDRGQPYLYCGFPVFRTNGSGPSTGGAVFLRALTPQRLAALSGGIQARLALVPGVRTREVREPSLDSVFGALAVSVAADEGQLTLDVVIPATVGDPVTVEAVYPRPIHVAAGRVSTRLAGLTGVLVAFLAVGGTFLVRRSIRTQVGRLRRTTEAVIASGDRTVRVGGSGSGEIAALGQAIDTMLEAISDQDRRLELEQAARQRQQRAGLLAQLLGEQHRRRQTQAVVQGTLDSVRTLLTRVLDEAETVLSTTATMDESVRGAHRLSTASVERTRAAETALKGLDGSLRQVHGITGAITTVAQQTHLLSLNATIEAARAGEAGKGFAVVAHEVKNLATTAGESSEEIARTIQALQNDAGAVSSFIVEVIEGIVRVDETNAGVGSTLDVQRAKVTDLAESVRQVLAELERLGHVSDDGDRRRHARIETSDTVELEWSGSRATANLLDISESGARCALPSSAPLRPGAEVRVIVHLADQGPGPDVAEDRRTLLARVQWHRPDEYQDTVGLAFVAPDAADVAFLEAYMLGITSLAGETD